MNTTTNEIRNKTTCDRIKSPAFKKIIYLFHVNIIFESLKIYKYKTKDKIKEVLYFLREFLLYN